MGVSDLVRRWIVFVCNFCNLHCEECSAMCHKPLGSTWFRRERWEIDVENYVKFLQGLPREGYHIRFTGGEPTAMNLDLLEELIKLTREYGQLPGMTTNGYGLLELSDEAFKQLAYVDLDDHGINSDHIAECLERIKQHDIEYRELKVTKHYIMEEAIERSQGKTCSNWLRVPGLYQGRLYPCCNSMLNRKEGQDLHQSLEDQGLTVDNPDWWKEYEALNWPITAVEHCLYNCWLPGGNHAQRVPITLKKNDVIKHPGR